MSHCLAFCPVTHCFTDMFIAFRLSCTCLSCFEVQVSLYSSVYILCCRTYLLAKSSNREFLCSYREIPRSTEYIFNSAYSPNSLKDIGRNWMKTGFSNEARLQFVRNQSSTQGRQHVIPSSFHSITIELHLSEYHLVERDVIQCSFNVFAATDVYVVSIQLSFNPSRANVALTFNFQFFASINLRYPIAS